MIRPAHPTTRAPRAPRTSSAPAAKPRAPKAPKAAKAVTYGDLLTEAQFQKKITDYAESHGWLWAHTPDSRRRAITGTPGSPDLWLVRGESRLGVVYGDTPRVITLEVKRQRGKRAPEQKTWADLLNVAGIPCLEVRPSDWPMIEAVLA